MARPKKDPNRKYVRKDVSMDPEQLNRIMDYCERTERPLSWVIRQALERYLEDNVA